jgi:hypothetical protein
LISRKGVGRCQVLALITLHSIFPFGCSGKHIQKPF